MKPTSKFTLLIILLFSLISCSDYAYTNGVDIGNGGTIVLDGESYSLADLHFREKGTSYYEFDDKLSDRLKDIQKMIESVLGTSLTITNPTNGDLELFKDFVFSEIVEYKFIPNPPTSCDAVPSEDLPEGMPRFDDLCTNGYVTKIYPKRFVKLDLTLKALIIIHERLMDFAPHLNSRDNKAGLYDFIKILHILYTRWWPAYQNKDPNFVFTDEEFLTVRRLKKRAMQLTNDRIGSQYQTVLSQSGAILQNVSVKGDVSVSINSHISNVTLLGCEKPTHIISSTMIGPRLGLAISLCNTTIKDSSFRFDSDSSFNFDDIPSKFKFNIIDSSFLNVNFSMGFDNRGFILNFRNINAENTSIYTNGFESLSLNNGNIKNIEEELRLNSGTELNTFTFSNCKSINIEKVRATDLTIQDCEGDLNLDFSDFEVTSIERASGTIVDSTIKSFIFKPKQPTSIFWEEWNVSSLRIINSVFLSPCTPMSSCVDLTGNGIEIIEIPPLGLNENSLI